jgi:hypothetical protein
MMAETVTTHVGSKFPTQRRKDAKNAKELPVISTALRPLQLGVFALEADLGG